MSSAKTIIANYRYKNKVEEVKEVIQSKSDLDIIKVLEYFENDVGKTIDAFINDDGKEAITNWERINKQKSTSQNNSNNSNTNNNKKQAQNNNNNNNNNNSKKSAQNSNKKTQNDINDLVASVIQASLTNTTSSSSASNNLNSSSNNLITNSLAGIKVVILGQEDPLKPTTPTTLIPNNPKQQPQLNQSDSLDKYEAELNKHIQSTLSTVSLNNLKQEYERSRQQLKQAYEQLQSYLTQRFNQLDTQLVQKNNQCISLFEQRQTIGNDLIKNLRINANKNEQQTKLNIQEFLNERTLDQDLANTKFIQLCNLQELNELKKKMDSFATLQPIATNYKKIKPILQSTQNSGASNSNSNNNTKIVNGSNSNNKLAQQPQQNGFYTQNNNLDAEQNNGGFIEVKKPQRKRNNKQNGLQTNGTVAAPVANGTNQQQNNHNYNGLANGHANNTKKVNGFKA